MMGEVAGVGQVECKLKLNLLRNSSTCRREKQCLKQMLETHCEACAVNILPSTLALVSSPRSAVYWL